VIACIMKATEGTSFVDEARAPNHIAVIKAGIACCTYHWLSPGNATEQMQFYLATVDPVGGERMAIDYEEEGCTIDAAVQALLDDPRGLQITVYSGHLLKEQLGSSRDDFLAHNTDLWLAQYTSGDPSWPSGTYDQWTLWQYSETGEVNGIDDTNVDLNRFNGSNDELVTWISPASFVAPTPEAESGEPVTVDIMAPGSIPVLASVNGKDAPRRRRRRRLLIPRGC
jgi:lysozyme